MVQPEQQVFASGTYALLYCPSDLVHLSPVIHSKENACPFLSECVSNSVAHQDLRCHRKLVEVFGGDVGFAPRNLDRSLMFRQAVLQPGPECDMCATYRPFDQEDDCKELSHGDDDDHHVEDERHHGLKSWDEHGTKGAGQAANATSRKIQK